MSLGKKLFKSAKKDILSNVFQEKKAEAFDKKQYIKYGFAHT